VVAGAWSQGSLLNQLLVENMPFNMCKELDKLNLRIIANMKVMEMEEDSTLL
jgi:hypothetical protein